METVKRKARDRWNTALGQMASRAAPTRNGEVFYTAPVYRCYRTHGQHHRRRPAITVIDHHTVHPDARPFYVDNWLWDTYRALEPLHTLLNPEMEADKSSPTSGCTSNQAWLPSFRRVTALTLA